MSEKEVTINDTIVSFSFGVGQIVGKEMLPNNREFFVVRVKNNDLTVLCPIQSQKFRKVLPKEKLLVQLKSRPINNPLFENKTVHEIKKIIYKMSFNELVELFLYFSSRPDRLNREEKLLIEKVFHNLAEEYAQVMNKSIDCSRKDLDSIFMVNLN